MSNRRLLSLSDIRRKVSTCIIDVKTDNPPIPGVIVRCDEKDPSLSALFSSFEKIKLEISNADWGGYHLSIMNDGDENEFYVSHFPSEKEVSEFRQYLEGTDGAWVIIALACDATFVFIDNKGRITGRLVTERDGFAVSVVS